MRAPLPALVVILSAASAGALKCLESSKQYELDMGVCGKRAPTTVKMCGSIGASGRWHTQAEMDLDADSMFAAGPNNKIPASLQPQSDAECRAFYNANFCGDNEDGSDNVKIGSKCSDFYCQNALYSADKYTTMCESDADCESDDMMASNDSPSGVFNMTQVLRVPANESDVVAALGSKLCCAAVARMMAHTCNMPREAVTLAVQFMHREEACNNDVATCRRVFVEMTTGLVKTWNSMAALEPGQVPLPETSGATTSAPQTMALLALSLVLAAHVSL